jgi:hypothetical protein
MDWRAIISGTWDKEMSKQLVDAMLKNEALFEEVFEAFYTGETEKLAHRGGHLLGRVFKNKPEWLYPKIELLFEKMSAPHCPTYRWHVLYYLSHTKYDHVHDGLAANYAFQELGNRGNKPGTKNTAMRLLEQICKRNPELIPEFKLYLQELIIYERKTLIRKAKSQIELLEKWDR